jgi:hypothetical protein
MSDCSDLFVCELTPAQLLLSLSVHNLTATEASLDCCTTSPDYMYFRATYSPRKHSLL